MSITNTGAGGTMIDPKTGLIHDYMGAWNYKLGAYGLLDAYKDHGIKLDSG